MRRIVFALLAAAVAACSGPSQHDLYRTTRYRLARSHGSYVTVGPHRIFTIRAGSGHEVVLLHGNPASSYSWRHVIEPLAASELSVHAIDLPGYGLSDKPSDASYEIGWFARTVVDYLDAVGIERATLVGNSMGGHIAGEIAFLYPDRVAALVLLGASGLAQRGDVDDLPLAFRAAQWPVVGPILRALPPRAMIRSGLESAVYDPSIITKADVDTYYLPLRSPNGLAAYLARMRTIHVDPVREQLLSTIRARTLIVTGDSDRIVPPSMAERYHELIAGSELVVFEKTGHLPQEEQPERTVATIIRFLSLAERPD